MVAFASKMTQNTITLCYRFAIRKRCRMVSLMISHQWHTENPKIKKPMLKGLYSKLIKMIRLACTVVAKDVQVLGVETVNQKLRILYILLLIILK